MTKQIPVTDGPWVHGDWVNGRIGGIDEAGWCEVWATEKGGGKSLPFIACKHQDMQANAAFIAVAGNVFHETGLTPRQLLEQRDALAKALEDVAASLSLLAYGEVKTFHARRIMNPAEATGTARVALTLVKGSAP